MELIAIPARQLWLIFGQAQEQFRRSALFAALMRLRAQCLRLWCSWKFQVALEGVRHLLCCFFLPLCMLWFSQTITLQSFAAGWSWLWQHGTALALFLPLFAAVQMLLRALLGSYVLPTLLGSGFVALVTLVNYYKTVLNGFPLMLSDLTLLPSAHAVASYAMPKIQLSSVTVCALLGFLLLILLAHRWRTKLPRRGWSLSALVLLALSLPLLLSSFGSDALLDRTSALTRECLTQEERLDRFGVLGGLYAAYAAGETADYSAYNSDTLNRLQNTLYLAQQSGEADPGAATDENAVRPHVLMILSESFFDVTRLDGVTFDEDPLPNFHRLSQTSTSGRFLSSTYAGGTGNVELEVLTGLSENLLKESDALTALHRRDGDVYASLPSLARDAQANGYATYYIHSHNSELYRRAETMPSLGFDEVVFSDDFETPIAYDGYYVSDATLAAEVIHRFENRPADTPVFMQITTMENHQPYTAAKYGRSSGISYTSDRLSESEREVLDALLIGLRDADAALGTLVDYFEQCGEPVMIVFYGDHLPSMTLSDTSTLYSALGSVATVDTLQWSPEELKEMLSTDYLIWTNYESEPAEDHTESSVLLGAHTLERAGLDRSAYFRYLNEDAGRAYLLSRPRLFVAADGTPYAEAPMRYERTLSEQRMMQYDLLYGEQRLAKYFQP